MSAYATVLTRYGNPVLPATTGSVGLAQFFREVTARAGARPTGGSVTIPVPTAITLQTITAGTLLQNNAAQTLTNLTAWRAAHTAELLPDQWDGVWTPERDADETALFLDASTLKMTFELIDDLVNGTPSTSITLPAGQLNFTTDGTSAKVWTALNPLDRAITGVLGKTQGQGGRICIITTSTGRGNLMTNAGSWYSLASETDGRVLDTYKGYPVFIYDGSISGWGTAADKVAAFVVHQNAEACAWADMIVPWATPQFVADGTAKKIWIACAFMGLLNSTHYAEVVNGSA